MFLLVDMLQWLCNSGCKVDVNLLSFTGIESNMSSSRREFPANVNRVIVGKTTESDPCRAGCVDNPNARIVRIVHISDTRSNNDSLVIPDGDILVHSGSFFNHDLCKDFSQNVAELDQFFACQPHKYKVFAISSNSYQFLGIIEQFTSTVAYSYLSEENIVGLFSKVWLVYMM